MRRGKFMRGLVFGNVEHRATFRAGGFGAVDADLIGSQLFEVDGASMRCRGGCRWDVAVNDLLGPVTDHMRVVLKYNAVAQVEHAVDFFHLLEFVHDRSNGVLDAVVQEVLKGLLVGDFASRDSAPQTGQERSALETASIGGESVVEGAEDDALLL
ncbi:hypothetical protein KNSL1_013756 [Colletotrichum chrysophilum]|nr:hypothetical protein KNSL1_013756 [Colletotrichum chrysophilum]